MRDMRAFCIITIIIIGRNNIAYKLSAQMWHKLHIHYILGGRVYLYVSTVQLRMANFGGYFYWKCYVVNFLISWKEVVWCVCC